MAFLGYIYELGQALDSKHDLTFPIMSSTCHSGRRSMRIVKTIYMYPSTALVEYIWCVLHICHDLGAFHGKISMSYIEIMYVYVLHVEVFMHHSQYIIPQCLNNSHFEAVRSKNVR